MRDGVDGHDQGRVETTEPGELTIERTFDAPRERVFEAWTDPKRLAQWWGPNGFTTATDEIDVRSGGVWRFVMTGPDGVEYRNRIAYDEIEPPERLVYTQGSDDDPEQFRVTVTFDGRNGDETDLTMRIRFASTARYDEAMEFGALEGAKQTLARLDDHLANGEDGGER